MVEGRIIPALVKEFKCEDCGEMIKGKPHTKEFLLCADCVHKKLKRAGQKKCAFCGKKV